MTYDLNAQPFDSANPALADVPFNTFANLASIQTNVEAIEAGLRFATGELKFVALAGPCGWGKTHLLEAIANRLGQMGPAVECRTLTMYLATPAQYEDPGILLLDDVQDVMRRIKRRQRLMYHLERRVRKNRPTFLCFNGLRMTRAMLALLPSPQKWTTCSISPPPPDERLLVLERMCRVEGLTLSPQLATIISQRLGGNGRTLGGAINRLRLYGSSWLGTESTLQACGLLEPFFLDNGEWDFARSIIEIAEANAHRFPEVSWQDLCLYCLLHVVGLSECDVSRSMGIEPAKAYSRANRFRKNVAITPQMSDCVDKFTELVVSTLAVGA